jgi:hypothetical protein
VLRQEDVAHSLCATGDLGACSALFHFFAWRAENADPEAAKEAVERGRTERRALVLLLAASPELGPVVARSAAGLQAGAGREGGANADEAPLAVWRALESAVPVAALQLASFAPYFLSNLSFARSRAFQQWFEPFLVGLRASEDAIETLAFLCWNALRRVADEARVLAAAAARFGDEARVRAVAVVLGGSVRLATKPQVARLTAAAYAEAAARLFKLPPFAPRFP